MRPLFLAHRWPHSTMSSHGGERALMSLSLLVRAPVLSNQGSILMTSLNKSHLSISNTVTGELGLHTCIGSGGTVHTKILHSPTEWREEKQNLTYSETLQSPLAVNGGHSVNCESGNLAKWEKSVSISHMWIGTHLKEVIDSLWFTASVSF